VRIVMINHVTLDGVMQSPGRPDEDTRDGFVHGGWAAPESSEPDPDVDAAVLARRAQSEGLLFGRRTYEDLMTSWNAKGGPFKDALNNAPKYVVSTTLREPLPWPNSTLLSSDIDARVAELKSRPGGDLTIMGSGQLIHALMRARVIDEFLLIVHPIVLGSGRRLFADDGTTTTLSLIEASPTKAGNIVATYRLPVA
jgi:dihydrofolate reductase